MFSMKLEGYLIIVEMFKFKIIFKYLWKYYYVIFYVCDLDDRDNEVLFNNNNVIVVMLGGCDMLFRSVVMLYYG